MSQKEQAQRDAPQRDAGDDSAEDDAIKNPKARFQKTYQKVIKWKAPENEDDPLPYFDTAKAWEALLALPSCQELQINRPSFQKKLNLVVGVNVTQEFPWKQITYRVLRNNLFDDLPHGQFYFTMFQGFKLENHVLLGYAPILTQNMEIPPDGDPFIMYVNPDDAKVALSIIRNMETYERLYYNNKLLKKPGRWLSYGSENEVATEKLFHEPVDVEIQSVYPMTIPAQKKFSFRFTKDVRDGYVQLVPAEGVRFDNVVRRRITVGIQTSMSQSTVEQQTDPTFPTNAWAQYLYEVKAEDGLDEESPDEEAERKPIGKGAAAVPKEPKPPPEMSDQIKFLLEQLEFNQVDMYRNDYPLLTDSSIMHYTTPYLEETLCFANISKSNRRYVCGFDWYPALAGLIVTSYTFSTPATIESVHRKVDYVQQAVLEPNPILMWSFNDNLNYKLEFESPLEITCLSFCPTDTNLLFGGASNGQLVVWDLQNRAEKLDYQETLTSAQTKYRVIIGDFLKWTIQVDEDMIVSPATISKLETSQKGAITGIYWLGKRVFVNSFGKVYMDPDPKARYRYFMTCSTDGTMSFWNLDAQSGKKAANTAARRDLPKALTQSESAYKGKLLIPVFTIVFAEPLTAIIADTSVFKCIVTDSSKARKNPYNYRTELQAIDPPDIHQSLVISSLYGHIERLNWQGLYAEAEGREVINTSIHFARVHDGPIVAMKKNPFFPFIFASIGRTVFAVWKESYNYSPIFWRKRKHELTAVAWSESCASVLFLTRIDGGLEAWSILSRDDDACLNDVLGGGIVTNICEHRPMEPEKLLGIGDYNSSLRMVKLPKVLYQISTLSEFKDYITKEESRKKAIQAWELKFYEKNKEFIESKRQAELEAHKEMERIEKETMITTKKEQSGQNEKIPTQNLSYTERMKHQWYELNLNRLMSILMTRKRVNEQQLKEETQLEKRRLAYEAAKKAALIEVLSNVANEVANVRLRIHPEEIPDLQRNDMIQSSVAKIMKTADSFAEIEAEANERFELFEDFDHIDYAEFLERGGMRRMNLDKSLGGNTERVYWYNTMRDENGTLNECNWGFGYNAELLQTADIISQVSTDDLPVAVERQLLFDDE
uniref:WD repeat-containing protein 63 n=1 Tax=Glossina morsitans morsitans TaxID=37546 RepID=A0A1B0G8D4_GLOMM